MDEMMNDERSRDSEMTEPDTADVSWPDSAGEGSRTEMFVTIEPNPRIFAAVVNHSPKAVGPCSSVPSAASGSIPPTGSAGPAGRPSSTGEAMEPENHCLVCGKKMGGRGTCSGDPMRRMWRRQLAATAAQRPEASGRDTDTRGTADDVEQMLRAPRGVGHATAPREALPLVPLPGSSPSWRNPTFATSASGEASTATSRASMSLPDWFTPAGATFGSPTIRPISTPTSDDDDDLGDE